MGEIVRSVRTAGLSPGGAEQKLGATSEFASGRWRHALNRRAFTLIELMAVVAGIEGASASEVQILPMIGRHPAIWR